MTLPPPGTIVVAMRRMPSAEGLKLAMAVVLLLASDGFGWLWRRVAAGLARAARLGWLPRLRARIARLPPAVALPLFLVPELCSRSGWIVSVWLLVQGEPGTAILVYAASKLVAGLTALWIYCACEPALMRVRWFAATTLRLRAAVAAIRFQMRPDARVGLPMADAREWLGARRR